MKKLLFFSVVLMLIVSHVTYAEIEIQEKFVLESPESEETQDERYLIIPKHYYTSLKEQQNISDPFRLPFNIKISNITDSPINLYHFYADTGEATPKNITKFIADENTEILAANNIEYYEIHDIPTISPPSSSNNGISLDLEIPLTNDIVYQDVNGKMRVVLSLANPIAGEEKATMTFVLERNNFDFDHDIKFDENGHPQMFLDLFNNNTVVHVYANALDPLLIEKNASEGARNAIRFLQQGDVFKVALKIEPEFAEENQFITPEHLSKETRFITYEFKMYHEEANYNQIIEELEEVTISGSRLLREILQAIHKKTNRSVNYEDGKGISITFEKGDSLEEFTDLVYQEIQEKMEGSGTRTESPKYIILYNKSLNTKEFNILGSTLLNQKEDLLNRYKLQPDRYPTAIKKLEREIEEIKQSLVEHEGEFLDPETIQGGSIVYFPVNIS